MKRHCRLLSIVLPLIAAAGILFIPAKFDRLPVDGAAYADTPRFEMDAVVVTATQEEETISDIPRNITVITAEEIEQATSSHVVDLLAREAGVTLQSLNGSDKNAAVDIRGMGATAANNVIVLVDGVRQNSSDLSGTDFSSIAMDQIERIEIMRGSGAVLYGDGAVGGVINIITKKPTGSPEKRLYLSYGSYATLDTRASVKGRVKGVGINLNTSYYDSGGYRDNGFLTKRDMSLKVDYDIGRQTSLWLSGSHHEDDYGLPGPRSNTEFASTDTRRGTDYPNDSGETTDQRIGGGFRVQNKQWGTLTGAINYRFRENPFVIGYNEALTRNEQTSEITEDSRTVDLRYTKGYTLFQRSHQIQLGLDHFSTRYIREALPGGPDARKNSAVDNLGIYITNHWQLTQKLGALVGYRHNRFDGTFRTDDYEGDVLLWANGQETEKRWDNDAYDLGLTWQFNPDVNLFASYATSFRVPNVDELAVTDDDLDLKPQTGDHIDAGAKFYLGERVECSVTLFHTRIEDEIYYSEINRNYDQPTIRSGVEADIKWYPTDRHYLWANYTYTDARFDNTDVKVPLVPEHKVSAGWEWQFAEALMLAVGATHVGETLDGNGITFEDNRIQRTNFNEIEAYTVVDSKITWTRGGFKFYAGVNNLFDEHYVTAGYSESYYPMPERNIYGGVEWRF